MSSDTEGAAQVLDAGASALPSARVGAFALVRRFGFAALIIVLDLWSKQAIFAWLERLDAERALVMDEHGHMRHPLIGEWFTLMLSLNPGAAFGHLDSVPWLLVSGRCIAVAFLVWLLVRTPPGKGVFTASLVLILGGALGNLYDNLLRARDLALDARYADHDFGPVRDFIDVYFGIWDWHFATFNVADACITVGAVLLLASSLFAKNEKAAER